MIRKVLHKPSFIPVPPFVLRFLFGATAVVLTTGVKVSSQKIVDLGYTVQYPDLQKALENILN